MVHRLLAVRENLHGIFHKSVPPVLWVDSGDTINFQTLEVGWRTERVVAGKELACIAPRDPVRDDGPALTGPVAVRGAEPGMTLEIQMVRFKPDTWGWTSAGGSQTSLRGAGVESEKASLFWDINIATAVATNQLGQQVPITPFLGTIGLASSDDAVAPGWRPHRRTAGNIDAAVLTTGASLFLPVEIPGAMLSVGDGHACQADGEIAGTAIECPMDEAEVRVILWPNPGLKAPRAKTAQGQWVTFGLGETLDEAASAAISGMLDLICEQQPNLSRSQALAWATSTVDLRITQMVNPLKGVHAVQRLPLTK